jgi:cation transport regulator ChaB
MKDPPATVKNLPSGAKKIFIDTFNSVFKEGKDEEKARMAAWSNVKLKYKKQGDKWVKKTQAGMVEVPPTELEGIDVLAKIPEMEESEPESVNQGLRISETLPIVRFMEEEGKQKAVYRVIKPGWSANGYYYSKEVTSQLVPLIQSKPMFFADHIEPYEKKHMIFGQKLTNGVAMAEEVWSDPEGQVLAKLSPLGNPSTQWIWEAAKLHPEHIGNSIDAYGKVKKGKAEGKEGHIVEKFTGYDSTDFVYRPAAGGKFIAITEAHQLNGTGSVTVSSEPTGAPHVPIQEIETEFNPLLEAAKTLKDLIKRHQKKSAFWNIGYMLTDFIYGVAVDRNMDDDEKSKAVESALKEFVDQLKEIDPVTLFNESLKNDTEVKPIDKLKSKLEENMDNKELIEALSKMTPAQLLEHSPDLYNKVIEASITDKEVQEAMKSLPSVKKERDELLSDKEEWETEKTDLEAKNKELSEKLKKYEDDEEKAKWGVEVDELIKESGINKPLITETFKNQLLDQDSKEKVQELLEDRKSLSKDSKFDNPAPKPENEKEFKEVEVDDKKLVRDLKANR